MLEKRRKCKRVTAFLLAVMLIVQLSPTISRAEQRSYTLSQGDKQSAEIYVKDSGVINVNYIPSTTEATATEATTTEVTTTEPDITTEDTTEDITTEDTTEDITTQESSSEEGASEEATSEASEDEAWFGSYHAGTMKKQSYRYWWYQDYNYGYSEPTATTSDDNVITTYTYKAVDGDGSYYDSNAAATDKLTINADGTFTALQPGTVTVYVDGKNAAGVLLFHARITFTIKYDMSKVSFSKTKFTGYMFQEYAYTSQISYGNAEFSVPIKSIYTLNSDDENVSLSVRASKGSVSVSDYSIENNVLHMQLSSRKNVTTKVKVTICDKTYTLQVTLKQVRLSDSGAFVIKGKTKRLKVKGYSGKITWKSSDPGVASVSSKGVVKAKKAGNALITAKVKGQKMGCVISVNTAQIKKVVTRARYIGTHWKYSQPKRTQSGYYDCSALVWKAYKYGAKYTFGSAGYPGTTVTESSYLIQKKRMIKGGYSEKKIQKLVVRPGDCVFKTTGKRTPANTYHVEMITGLRCVGFSDGTPIIVAQWGAREEGYGAENGSMMGRPIGSLK